MALNTMIKKESKKSKEVEAVDSHIVKFQQDLLGNASAAAANLNTMHLDQFNGLLLNEPRMNKSALLRSTDSLKANVKMLKKRKVVPSDIADQLIDALQLIKKELAKQEVSTSYPALYPAQVIESLVAQKTPNLVQYLMIRNSYADYANGDLKAFVLENYKSINVAISSLYHKLIEQAEEHIKTAMPVKMCGAIVQATSLAHYLLSFAKALERDFERCKFFMELANYSPYGVYQGAGTAFNINRDMVGRHMGFAASESNSHDAISDRSYVSDFLHACATIQNNLSRIVSDLIEWSAPGNEYIKVSSQLVKRSSMQLGDQDFSTLELVRSQAALSSGRLSAALSILNNGKSSSYSADFELLPELVFSAAKHLKASIKVCTLAISNIAVDKSKTKEISTHSYALANDLYEWLVENTSSTPNECAKITSRIIQLAQNTSKKLSLVDLDKMQEICPEITKDVYSSLVASRSIIAKRSYGGTNPVQVRKAIRHAKKKLKIED